MYTLKVNRKYFEIILKGIGVMIDDLQDRERLILERLAREGSLQVSELAQEWDLSEVSIRTILRGLEEKGWLIRTRGGAVPAYHKDILERQQQHIEEKHRIARAAAELIRDGDVVMIEAGTTTALITRYLIGKRDVHIVTNSTLAFSYARMNPALQVTMTGGEFRRPTESLVGPLALETIGQLNVRLAFVGTDGFSLGRGMTTHLIEGAEIVKAMKRHAEQTILVADSSKYGKVGFVSVLPLSAVALIITDSALPEAAVAELQEAAVNLKLV